MIIAPEQKVKEISAEKQNMSKSFNKLSAEINMVKLMCEGLKVLNPSKVLKKEVQSGHKY